MSTSQHLLGAGADGSPDGAVRAAAGELFERHQSMVAAICVRLLRDPVEAQDASQQAFLAAFRALLGGTTPRDPEAWLATIARHECLRRIRGRMREPLALAGTEPDDRTVDVHEQVVAHAAAVALWREIAALPPHQRDAVVLRELRGRSYEQVAAELGVTAPAVESLLFRARTRLRGRLGPSLRALDLPALVATAAGTIGRLFGSEVVPRLATPLVAKGAALTAGVAMLGGGAVETERHLAHPHLTPQAAAAGLRQPRPHAARPGAARRAAPVAVRSPAPVARAVPDPPPQPVSRVVRIASFERHDDAPQGPEGHQGEDSHAPAASEVASPVPDRRGSDHEDASEPTTGTEDRPGPVPDERVVTLPAGDSSGEGSGTPLTRSSSSGHGGSTPADDGGSHGSGSVETSGRDGGSGEGSGSGTATTPVALTVTTAESGSDGSGGEGPEVQVDGGESSGSGGSSGSDGSSGSGDDGGHEDGGSSGGDGGHSGHD